MSEVNQTKDSKPHKELKTESYEEIFEGKKTGILIVKIDDVVYRVGAHEGTDATRTALLVNKVISPRNLRLSELQDQVKHDPGLLKEIEDETDPERAKKLRSEALSNNAPFTRAMAEAWDRADIDLEMNLYREVLKHTSGPHGSLNNDSVWSKTFKGQTLKHLRPLRDIVIDYNCFFDLIDAIM